MSRVGLEEYEKLAANCLRRLILARPGRSRRRAVSMAARHLEPLVPAEILKPDSSAPALVRRTFDYLISLGDLVQANDQETGVSDAVYLGPPRWVALSSGELLLIGMYGEWDPPLPSRWWTCSGAQRHVRAEWAKQAIVELRVRGYSESDQAVWSRSPEPCNADIFQQYFLRLLKKKPGGFTGPLRIIGNSNCHHYKARWKPASSSSGTFVGRREDTYGAKLWCLVQLYNGRVEHLLDLPCQDMDGAPWDEPLRLQAAIDSMNNHPQNYTIHSPQYGLWRMSVYAPLPSWAERRLEVVGQRTVPTSGALITYDFDEEGAVQKEAKNLQLLLWMSRGGKVGKR